jgi:hypothetical protein
MMRFLKFLISMLYSNSESFLDSEMAPFRVMHLVHPASRMPENRLRFAHFIISLGQRLNTVGWDTFATKDLRYETCVPEEKMYTS